MSAKPKITTRQQEALFLAMATESGTIIAGNDDCYLVKPLTARNLERLGYFEINPRTTYLYRITPAGRAVAKQYEATP